MSVSRRYYSVPLTFCAFLIAIGCRNAPPSRQPVAEASSNAEGAPQETLPDFNRRIQEYVELHKGVSQPLGQLDDTKKPSEITAREVSLGQSIRAARAKAQLGDIFTPQTAEVLKRAIATTYRRSAEVRDTAQDAEAELPDFTPVVNQVYPPAYPLATFPATLFRVLPPLPEELEYRIVSHHLILRDVKANIIVDVLPNAIP